MKRLILCLANDPETDAKDRRLAAARRAEDRKDARLKILRAHFARAGRVDATASSIVSRTVIPDPRLSTINVRKVVDIGGGLG